MWTKYSERQHGGHTTHLFLEAIKTARLTKEHETYLPVRTRGLLVSQFAGDQEEAKILVDTISEQWNLV